MNRKRLLLILVFSFCIILQRGWTQNNFTESPYSRYGYGILSPTSSTAIRGMGGTCIGLLDKSIINNNNPATYAAVDSQTFIFDFAGSISYNSLHENKAVDHRLLGNLEYITTLMPITRWLALSMGIKPYALTGYKFGTTKIIDGSENTEYTEKNLGSGSLNDLYLGIGLHPHKNIYIGTNFAYRFGKTIQTRTIEFATTEPYNPIVSEMLKIRGFVMDAGVLVNLPISEKKMLSFGATYSPNLPMHSIFINEEVIFKDKERPNVVKADSVKMNGAYHTPHTIGLGTYFYLENMQFGADVKYSIWKNVFPASTKFNTNNQWLVSLGGAITPMTSARSIWKKSTYRFGVQGSNSYVTLPRRNGDVGYLQGNISLGMTIPLVDKRSMIDLSLDYTHLSPKTSGFISENYIRLTIGMRFNEGWFRKIRLN